MAIETDARGITPPVHLRIGNERRAVGSGGTFQHINPSNGQVDGEIPLAGADEVAEAVQVAHAAFDEWRHTPPPVRRRLLMRLADLIEENSDEFARRGALDNGVTVNAGRTGGSVEWTRYYAGWVDKLTSDVVATNATHGELGYTLAQPYGVIGIIITWNGPLISLTMKVPAAVAAGNTVVIKPSELTPFSGELFADCVEEAGFPAGVINILPGDATAGQTLVSHPLVKKVSFTGGPATARKILAACAEQMKPAVLELGGKSANIIFDDVEIDEAAVEGTRRVLGILSGQGCTYPGRMLVQRPIYEEMIKRVRDAAEAIVVGDPFDPRVLAGPVVNEAALIRILGMIERAQADGARLITGGSRIGGELADGYFIEPTVFADVDPMSELAQVEVFGPVLAMIPFDTEQEAVEIANATDYGLSANVRTNDIRRALRVAEALESGEVHVNGYHRSVNRPFGGWGISGMGKEGGREGIEEFLRIKGVTINS
jgi:aldehyde dehydrogenase (NAD+)